MINVYCIKDMKGDFNAQLLSFPNDDSARRAVPFISQQSELYQRYPDDFVLYRVGQFDFTAGVVIPESTPVYITDLTFGKESYDKV